MHVKDVQRHIKTYRQVVDELRTLQEGLTGKYGDIEVVIADVSYFLAPKKQLAQLLLEELSKYDRKERNKAIKRLKAVGIHMDQIDPKAQTFRGDGRYQPETIIGII